MVGAAFATSHKHSLQHAILPCSRISSVQPCNQNKSFGRPANAKVALVTDMDTAELFKPEVDWMTHVQSAQSLVAWLLERATALCGRGMPSGLSRMNSGTACPQALQTDLLQSVWRLKHEMATLMQCKLLSFRCQKQGCICLIHHLP